MVDGLGKSLECASMSKQILFGSKLLRLANCRDEDWKTYINLRPSEITDQNIQSIPFNNNIINNFATGRNAVVDHFKACTLYQMSSNFHENILDYPFVHFNIFNYKTTWITQLKNYINSDEAVSRAIQSDMLPKQFYHLLYQYYMIKEDTHWISDEAKAKVQKIHDLEMPSSYFEELRSLINSL